jgi:hypothetical protein
MNLPFHPLAIPCNESNLQRFSDTLEFIHNQFGLAKSRAAEKNKHHGNTGFNPESRTRGFL